MMRYVPKGLVAYRALRVQPILDPTLRYGLGPLDQPSEHRHNAFKIRFAPTIRFYITEYEYDKSQNPLSQNSLFSELFLACQVNCPQSGQLIRGTYLGSLDLFRFWFWGSQMG